MDKGLGVELLAYSFIVAGLGILINALAPGAAKPLLLTGFIAGGVCAVLALLTFAGKRSKVLPILVLAGTSFFLLSQTIHLLWPGGEEAGSVRSVGAAALVMLVLSVAMLMGIAWKGAFSPTPGTGNEPGAHNKRTGS